MALFDKFRHRKLKCCVVVQTSTKSLVANFYCGDLDIRTLWLSDGLVSAISLEQQVEMIERLEAPLTSRLPPSISEKKTAHAFHSSVRPSLQQAPAPMLLTQYLPPSVSY